MPDMVAEIAKSNPWDRLPDEGDKPFSAFRAYLAQGVSRSLVAVGRELGKSGTLVERWSSKFRWVDRAKAWEDEQARLRDLATADAIKSEAQKWKDREKELRELEYRAGKALIEKATKMLEYPLARTVVDKDGKTTIIEPTNWNQGSAARLMDVGSEVFRRASGLPTDHKAVSLSGPNDGPVQVAAAVIAKVIILPEKEDKPQ